LNRCQAPGVRRQGENLRLYSMLIRDCRLDWRWVSARSRIEDRTHTGLSETWRPDACRLFLLLLFLFLLELIEVEHNIAFGFEIALQPSESHAYDVAVVNPAPAWNLADL